MCKFSIIIPVYNVEEYLDACLQSIVEQTYQRFEVVLVDDASTDRSGKMCDLWAEKDSRIRVIHKENGGASSARNRGIDAMSGEYVLFLDSDDYWKSTDVLEKLASRIEITEPDVLIYNYQKEYNAKLGTPYFGETLSMPVDISCDASLDYVSERFLWTACAWNKAIRASLFHGKKLQFVEGIIGEDIDWSLRLCLEAERFDFLNICVVIYRQRLGSVTGSRNPAKVEQLYVNIRECLRILENAAKERADAMRPFVAYQYATLVHNVAMLPKSEIKSTLKKQTREMRYILMWSNDAKVRLIRNIWKAGGLSVVLSLLRLREQINKVCKKRSE